MFGNGEMSSNIYLILIVNYQLLIIVSNNFKIRASRLYLQNNQQDESADESIDNTGEFSSNEGLQNYTIFQMAKINAPKLPEFYPELFEVDIFTYENRKNSNLMPRGFTKKQHQLYMKTIEKTLRLFGTHKIEYMMFAGSLLGSWRHWDIIPWDDDFVSFYLYVQLQLAR